MFNCSYPRNSKSVAWLPILSLSCLLLFASCKNYNSETNVEPTDVIPAKIVEEKFDQVRNIHDEIMPERGRLIRLQKSVKNADMDPKQASITIERLERADDMMMNWMYADIPLNKLVDSLSQNEIMSYLDQREKEIQEVTDSMKTSILFAETNLAK